MHFDGRGRTAETDNDRHIRELIEQVLFTSAGERVNRPTFGSGVMGLVFAPNGDVLAAATSDGTASLRFGDGLNGMRPTSGTSFKARYRVGNCVAGNVGAEAIAHLVTDDDRILAVRNPSPAQGGREPESMERVRQDAPSAFRRQERAVTEADYAEVAERHPGVQRAAATFRWTGSWHTVFVTVDRLGGLPVDATFEAEIRRHLERYRMAGCDLEIDAPRFVSLDIEAHVCVQRGYFRSSVKAALLDVLSSRDRAARV